jgi:hypothetical protein
MSKLDKRRVAAGAAAGVLVCAIVGAIGMLASCAAIWDIEQPIPLGDDAGGGGGDAPIVDSAIPTEGESSTDAGSGDSLIHDADSASSDEPDAPLFFPDAGYTVTFPQLPFVDACLLPGATTKQIPNHTDAFVGPAPLPFAFPFYGVPQAHYWANTHGVLGFDGMPLHSSSVQCPLPKTTLLMPYPALYAFADNVCTGDAGICLAVTGNEPDKRFVVTWEDAYICMDTSTHLTFSVVLTESTNTIDLRYGTMTGSSEAQGSQATIGLEDESGMLATQYSCNKTVITSTPFAIHFTPAR